MTNLDRRLHALLGAFLEQTDTSARRFGVEALGDPGFMASLVGQGVAQAFQPQAVATGAGAAVANTGLGDIGRAGLGAGAGSAGQPFAGVPRSRGDEP